MSDLSVNFGDLITSVGTLSMEPVPKGTYVAKVIEAEPKQSSTGKLMFKLRYEIIDGGPCHSRRLWHNITLTTDNANALRMFFVNMKAMGLDESYFATNPQPAAIAGALLGRNCTITVDHRMYQGTMRDNVANITPPPAGFAAPQGGAAVPGAVPGFAPQATGIPAAPVMAPVAVAPAPVATPAPAVVVTPEPVAAPAPQAPAAPVDSAPAGGAPVPPPVPF